MGCLTLDTRQHNISRSIQHRHILQICKITDFLNCTWTNSTFRLVDNTLKTNIVTQISNKVEISNNIANFLTAVEFGSANHGIRNVRLEQGFLNCTGLGISPIENCKILMKEVLTATKFIDGSGYKYSLIQLIIGTIVNDLLPISVLSPEIFRTAIFIVFNNLVGRLENGFG
ncbi:Uncharacterised protein [Streptococcus pneumoniae]|nr:Uncharacterised protein [Streptococcus pneumoniae]